MKTIKIRNIEIGCGTPKIIVPIVGGTQQAILKQAEQLAAANVEVVEWRVDFFDKVYSVEDVLEALVQLRSLLPKAVLLFTFRSKKEGGQQEISAEYYTSLNQRIAESGLVDLVDVEIFMGDDIAKCNIANIHAAKKLVVGSNHDFAKTPDKDDLLYRLRKMQDMDADIPKIAVMPQNQQDVITLLSATLEMYTYYADRPIITMSMSGYGAISRITGELFGSCMTFGSVGAGSAPGQIPLDQLITAMGTIHSAL